jgi:hypothetical protein
MEKGPLLDEDAQIWDRPRTLLERYKKSFRGKGEKGSETTIGVTIEIADPSHSSSSQPAITNLQFTVILPKHCRSYTALLLETIVR